MGDGDRLEHAWCGVVRAASATATAAFSARVLVHLQDGALVRDGVALNQRWVPKDHAVAHPPPQAAPEGATYLQVDAVVARGAGWVAGQWLGLSGQLQNAEVEGILVAVSIGYNLARPGPAFPLPCALARLAVNADVGEDHEEQWKEEGAHR